MHAAKVLRPLPLFFLAALGLGLAGCASDAEDRPRPPQAAREHKPVPALAGQTAFFEGRILAEVRVGELAGFDQGPGRDGAGGRHGGPGGFRIRGTGGMHDTDGLGSGTHRGNPPPDSDGPREGPPGGVRALGRMAGPPVMIHLRFTNRGTDPVQLRIVDFLSPLGNFVVNPEKLTLAAGEAVEVEPMTSALAGEAPEGAITLQLQLAGKRETLDVELKREAPPGPESGKSGQSL